jgi:hypothetical protein
MQLKTAGDLRGFLADVLVGIKDGTVDASQAHAISKVAAQINSSLATEVQARMHLKGLDGEVAGSMVIAGAAPEEPVKAIAPHPPVADTIDPSKVAPVGIVQLEDATANFRRTKQDADRVWCDQCDMSATVAQAVGCKSRFCKAKEAA